MPQPKNIFLTGATGFLGSHLAARLLADGHQVMALARGSRNASAQARVEDVLREVGVPRFENLEIVEGDISLPDLCLNDALAKGGAAGADEIWHCAASLSFQQEDREEIFRMNVGGTRHVLDLVKRLRTPRLHHVSTAYVAGNRTGVALETEIN